MPAYCGGGHKPPPATRNGARLTQAANQHISCNVDPDFDTGWPYSDNDGIQAVIERWHLMQLQLHQND